MDLAGGIPAAAGSGHPVAPAGASNLLPFDFAAVLFAVTGENAVEPEPEAGLDVTADPEEQDSGPIPEQTDPAGWRPGNGWLPLAGLHVFPAPGALIDLDRTFGFQQPLEHAVEPAATPSTAAALPAPADAVAQPVAPMSPPEAPTGLPSRPLAFQLTLTGVDSAQPEVAAPKVPTQAADAASAPAPSTPPVEQAVVPPVPPRPDQPPPPPIPAAPETGRQEGTPEAAPQTIGAAQAPESARNHRDNSSDTQHREGQQQRPASPPVPQVHSPVSASEVRAEPPVRASTSESGPQPVAPAGALAAPAAPPARPITSVHIRLDNAAAPQPVDVHVRERGGEVHVAVRGADLSLNQVLRQDLPSLLQRLEEQGFRSEAWGGPEIEKLHSVGGADNSADANLQDRRRDGEPQRGREESPRQSQPDRDSSRQRRERRWRNEWMEITG